MSSGLYVAHSDLGHTRCQHGVINLMSVYLYGCSDACLTMNTLAPELSDYLVGVYNYVIITYTQI